LIIGHFFIRLFKITDAEQKTLINNQCLMKGQSGNTRGDVPTRLTGFI